MGVPSAHERVKFSEVVEEHETPTSEVGSPTESAAEGPTPEQPARRRLIPEAAGAPRMTADTDSESESSSVSEEPEGPLGPEDLFKGSFSSLVDSIEVSARRLKKLAKQNLLSREPQFGPRATAALRNENRSRFAPRVEEEVNSPAPAPAGDEERRVGGPKEPLHREGSRGVKRNLDVYVNKAGAELRQAAGGSSRGGKA